MSVWHYLAAAPHRGMFLAGALQGVFTLLWWVLDLTGRYGIAGRRIGMEYSADLGSCFLDDLWFFLILYPGFFIYHFSQLDEWRKNSATALCQPPAC